MEFRLLGPVEASDCGRSVDLGHARQRCVLAVLLLDAGRVVPTRTLIDRVWGHDPPETALNVLYGYIARLRKALAPHAVPLIRQSGGYAIDIAPDIVDLHRFHRLLRRADALADVVRASGSQADTRAVAAAYDVALHIWGGTPLAGLDSPHLAAVRQHLAETHLTAVLARNDAHLDAGRHASLVGDLLPLVEAHPDDERPAAQLMVALYRSGRSSEALSHYRRVRRLTTERFGTEPTPLLTRLHRQILRGDPALAQPGGHRAAPMGVRLPAGSGGPPGDRRLPAARLAG